MSAAPGDARRDCAALLDQGRALLAQLSDDVYTATAHGGRWSSTGAHLRHVIDYVDCLVSGADAGFVDYTVRRRNPDIERHARVGLREIARCIEAIEKLPSRPTHHMLHVRCDEGEPMVASTLAREIRFVSSHTIHHFALIRLTLSTLGIETSEEFGVSPSTLAHRSRKAEVAG
jgi:hypothetical protein